ncbi:hypothetical protein EV175_002770 [Coemansia sp. RSA 1933]|nr:hypothetical protein EV175_002770 [Coemansia sp. RSA 1933]
MIAAVFALRRILARPQHIGAAMAAHRCLSTAARPTIQAVQLQPSVLHQCRRYGSKKKGSKHKAHEVEEETDGTDTITLDIDGMTKHMSHCIDGLVSELRLLRMGRANPAILDRVRVKLDHGTVPLSDIAMVTVKDAHNLLVLANDPDHRTTIDSSIRDADLGLNPRIDKNAVIVPIPKPTKESRERLVKDIEALAERTRVHVRGHRATAMKHLKTDSKNTSMPKNEIKSREKDIQTATDKHIDKIKDLVAAKTHEIEKA